MSLNYAITLVHDLQLQNVNFDHDSKVVDYFHRGRHDIAEFRSIISLKTNLGAFSKNVKFIVFTFTKLLC